MRVAWSKFCLLSVLSALSFGCAIGWYPGQPGMKTNNFSKINLEFLDWEGLWVYETSYDNTAKGSGVNAIVTYLYPDANTFTTNGRTNADGTLYSFKHHPRGGIVQLISMPKARQYIVPEDSRAWFWLWYDTSLDEVDDVNLAEINLFNGKAGQVLSTLGKQQLTAKFNLLRAGTMNGRGNIAYKVETLDFAGKEFKFDEAVEFETNFFQTSVRSGMKKEDKAKLKYFVETNFAKGFDGEVKLKLKGATDLVSVKLQVHTPKTIANSQTAKIVYANAQTIQQYLK